MPHTQNSIYISLRYTHTKLIWLPKKKGPKSITLAASSLKSLKRAK